MLETLKALSIVLAALQAQLQTQQAHAEPLDLHQVVEIQAQENGLNASHMEAVIECESHWNPTAVGDHGTSFGLVQVHLSAHPSITKEMALDPIFSIVWMAQEWKNNRQSEWSCTKIEEKNGWE